MSEHKVYRIHDRGESNIDWFNSEKIDAVAIEHIRSENITKGTKLPTSIPSPFARIDLVRDAFAQVVQNNYALDGETDYHKLISDCLDIGQIFFNYDVLKNDFKIITWNKEENISKLIDSDNLSHKQFGKTLQLFLDNDTAFNFAEMQAIHILTFENEIIGATSPVTMFFAAAFDQKELKIDNIKIENDILFNPNNYKPLYQRQEAFVQYLYMLSMTSGFTNKFTFFKEYIDTNIKRIKHTKPEFYKVLQSLTSEDVEQYAVLSTTREIENLGFVFRKNQIKLEDIETSSFLTINTSVRFDEHIPLAIPQSKSFFDNNNREILDNSKIPYISSDTMWNENIIIDDVISEKFIERILPEQNIQYPYIVADDILEDTIFKLPYEINTDRFLTFSIKKHKYLIPIKKLFIDLFGIKRLQYDNLVKFVENTESIDVQVKIPLVNNNFLQYEKRYFKSQIARAEDNKIIEMEFGLAVFPLIDYNDQKIKHLANYRVGLIDFTTNRDNNNFDLKFFENANSLDVIHKVRSSKDKFEVESKYYIINTVFDSIQITDNRIAKTNLIIPKFKAYQPTHYTYTFAIDFGTTNTHIEYKNSSEHDCQTFDINQIDQQVVMLRKYGNNEDKDYRYIQQELLPAFINEDNLYQFPIRTVLFENNNIDLDKSTHSLVDYNIGFDYEKISILEHLNIVTNLKWGKSSREHKARIQHYIGQLLEMIKNKIILENGQIKGTKIVWFYPNSMSERRKRDLHIIWLKQYARIFLNTEYTDEDKDSKEVSSHPESVSPFYYYRNKRRVTVTNRPGVSIDIGGGTTDAVIIQNNEPTHLTSFAFAGEAIFGDGYLGAKNNNGFYRVYKDDYTAFFEKNVDKIPELKKIFDKVKKQNSIDFVNFLLSLNQNKTYKEHGFSRNFNDDLAQNDNFKIIFLLFYYSLIYHLAETFKKLDLDRPNKIMFSGNGSKTLELLSTSKVTLEEFFEKIFDIFYDPIEVKMEIYIAKHRKEITSRGGIYAPTSTAKYKSVVNFDDTDIISVDNRVSYDELKQNRKKIETTTILRVETMLKQLSEINKEFNLQENFEINANQLENLYKKESLIENVKEGITNKLDEIGDNTSQMIDETIFFYPIIGLLNQLNYEIISK